LSSSHLYNVVLEGVSAGTPSMCPAHGSGAPAVECSAAGSGQSDQPAP
ncbi:hypothetical protein L195_g064296, partial [Trifolium pratense]